MAHSPSALGSITYAPESSFADTATDATGSLRIPHTGVVDVSGLVTHRYPSERTQQFLNAGDKWIEGTQEGEFKTRTYLFGFGSTTAGAVTKTAYQTWLGYIFGTSVLSASSGDTITGGTVGTPTTTGANGFANGSLAPIGALGDGDGGGQVYAIASHASNDLTLLTELPAAPANGAALRAGCMVHTNETDYDVTSLRFKLATADYQYICRGCAAKSWAITGYEPGGRLILEVTWHVASYKYANETFPVTTATDTSNPGPNAAGSLFVNTVGTATNATRTYYSFQMDVTNGMEILRGPGGVSAKQDIVGYRRTPSQFKVSWVEAAEAATTSPTLPNWTDAKHVLLTLSTADGSTVAMYWPNVCPADPTPVQFADQNLNRIRFTGMAYTGPTTDTDLEASAFRMLLA